MKQKTIRLGNNYRLNDEGTVDVYGYIETDENYKPIYGWTRTRYCIGANVVLISRTNVSPNSLRRGTVDCYSLVFDADGGIGGNLNPNIKRYHGWRGTTQDISTCAHGMRKIIKIRELKNGDLAVTVGPDLTPQED